MDARKTDADQAAMRFSFHRQTIIENVIGPLSKATQPVTPLHCSGKRRLARSPARHPHAAGGVPPAKQPLASARGDRRIKV